MINGKSLRRMAGSLAVFVMLSLSLASGCARKPSERELTLLEETRMAAESAEKTVKDKKAEKAKLEDQLAQRKQELKSLEAKRDAVKSALESQ